MSVQHLTRLTTARLPTGDGGFQLHLYRDGAGGPDHLALVMGEVVSADVLVRVHSECLTGEVFGSTRCDCRDQLQHALGAIAAEGAGAIVYLRQEGRGIGLAEKLRAYNLQDEGYDTVDANLVLGHAPDARDYGVAAAILRDLGVRSVRLLTNNPDKLAGLRRNGYPDCTRVPIEARVTPENAAYLETKVKRLRHLLDLGTGAAAQARRGTELASVVAEWPRDATNGRPFVTLTYAQSLDGSISVRRGESMTLSNPGSLAVTHALRARHDAILVGIGTVLADDPRLTVRLVEGRDPRPIVLDSALRTPLTANLLGARSLPVWIATTDAADKDRQAALERRGARVLRLPANAAGQVDIDSLLACLRSEGIGSVMVEGGARVITSFLARHLVDRLVLTIAPLLVGGLNAVENLAEINGNVFPSLRNPRYRSFGDSLVLVGDVDHQGR